MNNRVTIPTPEIYPLLKGHVVNDIGLCNVVTEICYNILYNGDTDENKVRDIVTMYHKDFDNITNDLIYYIFLLSSDIVNKLGQLYPDILNKGLSVMEIDMIYTVIEIKV